MLFSYVVDCPDGACDLSRKSTLDIAALNVLVPDSGVQVAGQQVAFQGRTDTPQGAYASYLIPGVAQGQTLQLQIKLAPAGSVAPIGAAGSTAGRWPWLLGGLAVSGLVLGYPFWKQRIVRDAASAGAAARETRPAPRKPRR